MNGKGREGMDMSNEKRRERERNGREGNVQKGIKGSNRKE